jgi:hypothetical protein
MESESLQPAPRQIVFVREIFDKQDNLRRQWFVAFVRKFCTDKQTEPVELSNSKGWQALRKTFMFPASFGNPLRSLLWSKFFASGRVTSADRLWQ